MPGTVCVLLTSNCSTSDHRQGARCVEWTQAGATLTLEQLDVGIHLEMKLRSESNILFNPESISEFQYIAENSDLVVGSEDLVTCQSCRRGLCGGWDEQAGRLELTVCAKCRLLSFQPEAKECY